MRECLEHIPRIPCRAKFSLPVLAPEAHTENPNRAKFSLPAPHLFIHKDSREANRKVATRFAL